MPDYVGWDEQQGHASLCWIFMRNMGQQCAMQLDLMHLHGAHTYIICILALSVLHMQANRGILYECIQTLKTPCFFGQGFFI